MFKSMVLLVAGNLVDVTQMAQAAINNDSLKVS
jgi:hypothetical protein